MCIYIYIHTERERERQRERQRDKVTTCRNTCNSLVAAVELEALGLLAEICINKETTNLNNFKKEDVNNNNTLNLKRARIRTRPDPCAASARENNKKVTTTYTRL